MKLTKSIYFDFILIVNVTGTTVETRISLLLLIESLPVATLAGNLKWYHC